MHVTIQDIRRAIQQLDLSGRALCVHSSLRSFGYVEGGAATILQGLLDEGCTVLVPSFTYSFAIPAPPDATMRPARNSYNYAHPFEPAHNLIYTPALQQVVRDMGALPAMIATHPQRVRGNHPLNSFAAIGPLAEELITDQAPMDVYAPFRALLAHQGTVIMMGIGLQRMTLIHFAEQQAGRTLFQRWANGPDGKPMMVEVGSCSEGFGNFDLIFAPFEQRLLVGQSLWRLFDAHEVVDSAANAIRQHPHITHCADENCIRCNDAIKGGPLLKE